MTRQKGVMKSLKLVGFSQISFPIRTKLLSSQEFRDRRVVLQIQTAASPASPCNFRRTRMYSLAL
jgi:hypothetical protein